MARSIAFRSIDRLCSKLLAHKSNAAWIDKVLSEGIRERALESDALPFILQRLVTRHSEWRLALRVLESARLDQHHIRRDDTLWKLIESGVPVEAKPDVTAALRKIYAKKNTTTSFSSSSTPHFRESRKKEQHP